MDGFTKASSTPQASEGVGTLQPASRHRTNLGSVFARQRAILPSTIGELPSHTYQVKPEVEAAKVVHELERDQELPGVLVVENGRCVGMVSRQRCFEQLGRPFGVEVFLGRPIVTLNEATQHDLTVMPGSTRVDRAVDAALARSPECRYEPIVVQRLDQGFQMLDIRVLLLAQSQLLANANRLVRQQIEIGHALSSRWPPEETLELILRHLATVVPYNRGGLVLQVGQRLEFKAQHGFPLNTAAHHLRCAVSDNDLYRHLLEAKTPLLVPDVSSPPTWEYLRHFPTVRTALAVPLIQADTVIGMLLLMRVFANAPYTAGDLEIAETFAAQSALALQNTQLAVDQRAVTARQKDLERFQAPAWNKLRREIHQVLSTLINVSHHMLDVPVETFSAELRQQFMSLQNAGQRLQIVLKQMEAAHLEDAPSHPPG